MSDDLLRPSDETVDDIVKLLNDGEFLRGRRVNVTSPPTSVTYKGNEILIEYLDRAFSNEMLRQLEKNCHVYFPENPSSYLVMSRLTLQRINMMLVTPLKENDSAGMCIVKINNNLIYNKIIKIPFFINLA